jgi:hypothetical protein
MAPMCNCTGVCLKTTPKQVEYEDFMVLKGFGENIANEFFSLPPKFRTKKGLKDIANRALKKEKDAEHQLNVMIKNVKKGWWK